MVKHSSRSHFNVLGDLQCLLSLSSGICNPRVTKCGYAIRAGRDPLLIPLWIANPQGQRLFFLCLLYRLFPSGLYFVLCLRGFAIPETLICGFIIRAGHRPADKTEPLSYIALVFPKITEVLNFFIESLSKKT